MGRLKVLETYTCDNCVHIEDSDCESCFGCKPLSKDTMKPRGWEPKGKDIPQSFDATAFIRAMKGQPITRMGVKHAIDSMVNNLELKRSPYYTMTKVHQFINNVPAVYVDDGKHTLVIPLDVDEFGKCTGKIGRKVVSVVVPYMQGGDKMNLLEERKRIKKSQMEMAAGIGVSINTYVHWERNVMNPNPENEAKIIAFLMKEDEKRRE